MDKKEIRTMIRTTLEEFVLENRQVLVSYDITKDFEKLRTGILDELDEYGKRKITKSTYMLEKRLNLDELDELVNSIKEIFNTIKESLNEARHEPKSVRVVILTTLDNSLFEEVIIDEEI